MSETPRPSHTERLRARAETKPPRLLIFDDKPEDLRDFVAHYTALGFEAIGVPMLNTIDTMANQTPCDSAGNTLPPEFITNGVLDHSYVPRHQYFVERLNTLNQFDYAAYNSSDVQALLKQLKPDAVLSDRSLSTEAPFKTGYELLSNVHSTHPHLPCVMHTDGMIDDKVNTHPYLIANKHEIDRIGSYLHEAISKSRGPSPT